MQTQLERAAIGGVRATESYGFRPVHKAPRKSLKKTSWWVACCKLFTCCWKICSQQQHKSHPSSLAAANSYSATPHSEFSNESCVSVPERDTLAEARLLQPEQRELLLWELSSTVQECLECFSQQVLERFFSRKCLHFS